MNNLYSVARSLFLSTLFLISLQAFGQQSVSIGTTEIKSNAVLYLLGSGSQGLIIPVTANPSSITPTAGMVVFNSSDQKVYFCDGTNWAPINGGVGATDSQTLTISGNTISISNGNSQNIAGTAPTTIGQILTWDGSKWTSSTGANAPAINQVLQWNGTSWVPTTLASGGSVTSVATGTGLTGGPITTSGTIALANTAVTAGTYGSATSIPQLTVDAQGRITTAANLNIPNANTTTTGLLSNTDWNTFNNKLGSIPTLGGDISGTLGAVSVDRIKSVAVSVNAPTVGQILQYNGTQWAPATLALGGTVTTVTGTLPISVTNNTTTPSITIAQAGAATNGYLSSADWTTFNNKLSNPMTAAGDIIYGGASGTPTRLATGTGFLRGGATPSYSAVNLASADVSGTLALTNGGTGASTAAGARTSLGLGTLATLSTVTATEITDGTIAAADLSSMSATNGQILKYNGTAWVAAADDVGGGATPTLANGQILVGNGATNSAAALSGDATLSAGVITIGAGVVTSTKIADGTIAAADLSSMGATSGQVMQYNGTAWVPAAGSGLSSTLNNGNIFVGNGSNVATGVAMSGDATISNTGALTLANSASTRTNLGLGSLATLSTITTTEITNGTIAAIDLANSSVSGGAGGVITDASITAADLGVGSVDLASTDVTGTLPLTLGGTGATTAAGARTSLGLGTLATVSTVTSAEITDATITAADLAVGSVDLSTTDVTGTLPLTLGGTGATTAAGARTSLGLGTLATLNTVTTTEITDGTIAAADLSSMSATNGQILKYNGTAWIAAADDVGGGATPTLANGQILIGNGTTNSAAALSGDATLAAGVITIGTGVVTSTKIADGTIAAADLSSMGATNGQVMQYNGTAWVPAAGSGLSSTLSNGNIFVGNGSNVATGVAMSGDATISNAGVVTLANSASTRTNLGLGSLATLSTITTTEITNGTIAAVDLANSSVSGGAGGVITDASITAADLGVGSVDLTTTDVTGTLPLTLGGTGATTAAGARTSLGLGSLATLSAVTSTEITDATITAADLGVGSVDLATTDVTGTLPLTLGGTGATTATAARTNLGLGALATLNTVGTTEITDASVTNIKISNVGLGKLLQGGATTGQILKWDGAAWSPAADDVGGGATPTLANGQILIGNGTTNSAAALSGDATLAAGVITIGAGTINSSKILDGSIDDVDLSSMGATANQFLQYDGTIWAPTNIVIGSSQITDGSITGVDLATGSVDLSTTDVTGTLPVSAGGTGATTAAGARTNLGVLSSTLANTNIYVGNAGTATAVAMSGDATLSNTGVLTIGNNAIGSPEITDASIANADLAAGSVSGGLGGVIADGTINAADLASMSATNGQVLQYNGSLWAPATIGGGVTTLDGLTDVTVTTPSGGQVLVNNGSGQFANVAMSGDGSITAAGALTLTNSSATRTNLGLGTLSTLSAVGSTEITNGSIAATDLATGSVDLASTTVAGIVAIANGGTGANTASGALTNLGALGTSLVAGNIWVGNGTNVATPRVMSGDATITNAGVITIGTGAINSAKILDGTIAAADLAVMGATTGQVLTFNGTAWAPAASISSTLTSGNIYVGNSGNVATSVAMTGDATLSNAGVLTIADASITNQKIASVGLGKLLQGGATTGQVVKWDGAAWSAGVDNGMTNPMTTAGDIIVGGASGTPTRLASPGASRAILGYNGTIETWVTGGNNQLLGTDGSGNITFLNQSGFITSALPNGQILVGNAGAATATTMSGDATLSAAGVLTLAAGSVSGGTVGDITDATITGADLAVGAVDLATTDVTGTLPITLGGTGATTAVAARTNLGVLSSALTSTNIYVGNNLNTATAVAMSGDGTLSNTGVLAISSNAIGSAEITDGSIAAADLAGTAVTASNGLTATTNNITLGGTLAGNTTISMTTFDLALNSTTGGLAVGTTTAANRLDVEGNAAIGAGYSGSIGAPVNGLIVEGNVGIGTSAPGAALQIDVSTASTNTNGLELNHSYAGAAAKYGIYNVVSVDGSSNKFGIRNEVNGAANAITNYGVYNFVSPNAAGSGTHYGTFNSIPSAGTGSRYGTYNNVTGASGNTSAIYGLHSITNHSGSGIVYGSYIDANKAASQAGEVYGQYVISDNDGTGASYLMYANSIGSTTGTEYGLYVTGEDQNYFSNRVGIGTDVPGAKLHLKMSGTAITDGFRMETSLGTGEDWYMYMNSSNNLIFRDDAIDFFILQNGTGRVGIGRTPTANDLEVNGTASKTASGSWLANSDRRIKTDILDVDNSFDLIRRLRPVKFKYTPEYMKLYPTLENKYYYNFIAQEFQQVFPDAVKSSGEKLPDGSDEILQIDTYDAQIVTIKAVQELIAKLEKLETENKLLREQVSQIDALGILNEIRQLKSELAALKTQNSSVNDKK